MSTMYRLPPIIPPNMEFDLPTCMYKLPSIQKFETQQSESSDEALKALEERQEKIINQLEALKLEVNGLQQKTTLEPSSTHGVRDIVIRAPPTNAPLSLPLICAQLQRSLQVVVCSHVHSSLPKGIPNALLDFLPASNCSSRTLADLNITLIWTAAQDLELVTSPTSTCVVKGEVNLVRYFARRFNLFNHPLVSNDIKSALVESLLDELCIASYTQSVKAMIEPSLKKSKFLACGLFTVADGFAYSLMKKAKGGPKLPPSIQEWMKRCEKSFEEDFVLTKPPVAPTTAAVKPPTKKGKPIHKSTTNTAAEKVNFSKYKPGDICPHQWPEIPSVYLCPDRMADLTRTDPIALVSEKLDGSNLSISSRGLVCSRRKVLLVNPNPKELADTQFAGESLASLGQPLKAVRDIPAVVFKQIFPYLDFSVTVFGEWLQKGTASSKEDKFGYASRSLVSGQFYGFGLGLALNQPLPSNEVQKVIRVLGLRGFSVHSEEAQANDFFVILLNGELKHLFNRFGMLTVPILQTLPTTKVFAKMAGDLVGQKVEGFVITIPSQGIILKWKGCEDTDPRRVEALVELAEKCKIKDVVDPLNKVLQESLLYNAHGKKRYFDPDLIDAFNSARSKFPRLDDILANKSLKPEHRAQIIEGYKFTLAEEIIKDFGKAFGCTKESIMAFVNQEVKP